MRKPGSEGRGRKPGSEGVREELAEAKKQVGILQAEKAEVDTRLTMVNKEKGEVDRAFWDLQEVLGMTYDSPWKKGDWICGHCGDQ